MHIEQLANRAMGQGDVTRTPCPSKQAVLDLIKKDEADTLSVTQEAFQVGEFKPNFRHFAIRFNDRELGEQVRQHTMRGFGL